jgi:hypothetical protein
LFLHGNSSWIRRASTAVTVLVPVVVITATASSQMRAAVGVPIPLDRPVAIIAEFAIAVSFDTIITARG